jgi:hypothetical protein
VADKKQRRGEKKKMTQLRTTILALGIMTLVMMTMMPIQAIAKEKKIELSEGGQKQYNDLKEGYFTTFTQSLAGKLSESEVREIVEGVFEGPSIMKDFEEAYQYAEEPSELPQFTKHFEEWMSNVGSGITEKLAEGTVN